jgi:indole-3-glycerol phosphate synthase
MTPGFLEEIVAHVREDSVRAEYENGVPPARARPPPSLRAAVERDRARGALLVEYKRASPGSRTPLPAPRTIPEFLAATAEAEVAGYSCLATSHGFSGTPAYVADLAGRTSRPVLFKEFVLGRRQLDVAARTGASAVLLIARLEAAGALEAPLAELAAEAHRRGLEVLLELHDPAELSRADGVAADVVGVNARDLDTLRLDRPRAYTTLERARDAGVRPLLGLSGVDGPGEANAFWSHGCDGILVGSAVARASNPSRWLASLRRTGGS